MAGLFRPESDFDGGTTTEEPTPSNLNITGLFRAFYLASGESSPLYDFINLDDYSAADRKAWRTGIRGAEANIKSEGRKINRLHFDALIQLLHSRGRLSGASWLRSNRFRRSGGCCWLAGPGGFLANSTSLSWAEYQMSLCIRLLRSPASLDVGDAEGGILFVVSVQQAGGPELRFPTLFHCRRSQQGQLIRRHDHMRDALHDMIGASIRDDTPYNISLTIEPLVRLFFSIPDSLASTPDPPDEEKNDPDAMDIAAAMDAADYIEDIPRLYFARTTLAVRRARGTEDKAAGQCRGDLGVSVDSLTNLLDLAVADATARSYRPPLCSSPAATTPPPQ